MHLQVIEQTIVVDFKKSTGLKVFNVSTVQNQTTQLDKTNLKQTDVNPDLKKGGWLKTSDKQ